VNVLAVIQSQDDGDLNVLTTETVLNGEFLLPKVLKIAQKNCESRESKDWNLALIERPKKHFSNFNIKVSFPL
jgi:hypothetical protein